VAILYNALALEPPVLAVALCGPLQVYFGGGSVALATPEGCWHVAKCDPGAALTDGTPNFLGAAALSLAYDSWDSRGGAQVRQ
jgi:selenocysteine lyase/cysteine desulfurase